MLQHPTKLMINIALIQSVLLYVRHVFFCDLQGCLVNGIPALCRFRGACGSGCGWRGLRFGRLDRVLAFAGWWRVIDLLLQTSPNGDPNPSNVFTYLFRLLHRLLLLTFPPSSCCIDSKLSSFRIHTLLSKPHDAPEISFDCSSAKQIWIRSC